MMYCVPQLYANSLCFLALQMAYKPTFSFPTKPKDYAASPVPSLDDWKNLWIVWDLLTRQMIPEDELLAKPIKLRNACIFYIGHIPTFLDIHLSKATGNYSKELEYYQKIFERGIDPDVDNPELCHDHSEIPDTYPPVSEIVGYQGQVRDRVKSLFDSGDANGIPAVRKALWIGFEHEAMHLETLLYMLVQSEKTLPPTGVPIPDFRAQAAEAVAKRVHSEWITIPARTVKLGLNDPDVDLEEPRYFGWDNEKPARTAEVGSFVARSQPITNREYAEYLEASGIEQIPASWTIDATTGNDHVNGYTHSSNGTTNGYHTPSVISDKAVRTVFGKVPLRLALDWPVMASYDELAGCAQWMGGRIPALEEVQSIYQHVDELKSNGFENRAEIIPAVNSHLINNGVEETPPSIGSLHRSSGAGAALSPDSFFVDLKDANVGFKNWHPVPVTGQSKLTGQAETGGVWEWTSTVLEKHEGFEPMRLYPGYTGMLFVSIGNLH
jgi:L-histidine Nalpha-methyltransferase / hercynylcysteine S-oxide synthase